MKFLFLVLSFLAANKMNAQNSFHIKVQNQSLSVNVSDDNAEKTLFINSKASKNDKLAIHNPNKAEQKDWKRSFMIFDESDRELIKLSVPKKDMYEISVTKLLVKLRKDEIYSLYTIAIPTDPKRAAVVRVRRVLLCKLMVK